MENQKTLNYKRPPLYEYQERLIDSPARYTVCEASTKVGKTASHIIWLFEQALQGKENQNFFWVAPVYSQAEVAFKRMKSQVTDHDFFRVNETKLTLTLPNGACIHFKSGDKPDSLYSDDVYACVIDEFTRCKEDVWTAIRTTITATNGKVKFIGNVRGKGWGYKLALRAKQDKTGVYEYHKITALDAVEAGLLSQEEIDQAKTDLPEAVFNELYLAEAQDAGTNPFGFKYIDNCISELSMLNATSYGIDLAKSTDYTVIIGLDDNCEVCYFERFQNGWEETKARIRRLPKNIPIRCDSTGVGDPIVEDLQDDFPLLEGFHFSSKRKQQIMEGLATAIQQNQIRFPEGFIEDELKAFEYEVTRTGVKYSAPSGIHDDCVCALALALSCWTANRFSGQYCVGVA